MLSRRTWQAAGCAVMLAAMPVSAQQLKVESGPVKLTVTGRMQFQFNTTSVELEEGTSPAASTYETRRVRLAASLVIDDWITGMVEPDFALGRLQLRQAWMELGFHPAFGVRAGQWKKPFSLIQLTSSAQIPMIERTVRIRGLHDAVEAGAPAVTQFDGTPLLGEEQELLEVLGYDGYDMGAAVRGRLGGFGYELGMFNGNGSDARDENDGKSLAGRATYTLPTSWPVTLGAGVSRRDHVVTVSGTPVTEHGTAWEADLELGSYRRSGPWVLAEYAQGSNLVTGDFRGAQAVAAWFVSTGSGRIEGVEPVFRWSFGDPDVDVEGDGGMLFTPGLNFHFFGRNKLMVNWDVYVPESDALTSENAVRAQMQLYF
jgi:phosphate-selective porin